MQQRILWLVVLILGVAVATPPALGASARIVKVLPHLLDAQGRHTTAPSLYERDAYQAHLRQHPELVKALRFDVRWKYSRHYMEGIRLRLEVRGAKSPKPLVLEQPVERRPWYQRWTSFDVPAATYQDIGEVVAWRATLWDGDRQLAQLQSFLW